MKSGKLAFTLAEGGERKIDISELERVFGTRATIGNGAQTLQSDDWQRREIETLREFLTESRAAVADLRRRLDDSEAERRRRTLLLSPPTPSAPDQPRPLGRRILAWLVKQHAL